MTRIGCFHAHYSNIELIEQALSKYDAELIHFVDPGLDRLKRDADFTAEIVEKKVVETLDWIAKCHVDAILITCTFFTAVYNSESHRYPIPVIKIDEPLFGEICSMDQPVMVAFTNPGTVNGTMDQLLAYAKMKGIWIEAEPVLIEDTFDLIMQGKKSEYIQSVLRGLIQLKQEHPQKSLVAAQLSMVPAAQQAEEQIQLPVGNQLKSLSGYMERILDLKPKI